MRLAQTLVAASLALDLVACAPAEAATDPISATPDGRPLELTFADEFDSFRRLTGNDGVWRTTFGDGTHEGLDRRSLPTNGEMQFYVDPDLADERGPMGLNPFSVEDGVLTIIARPTPPGLAPRIRDYRYVSGVITTQPSLNQTYGYFEMRARLPEGKGLWPAFWLLPADLSWPPEIDVMESIGDPTHVEMTSHSTTRGSEAIVARVSAGEFHTYAVSWDREDLIWYVDGREVGRQKTPGDMHKPMFMLANLAVGGNWPGAPDASTRFPARYEIDFIRAYRFAS
jgi:beta-glucanase (GH16 family)